MLTSIECKKIENAILGNPKRVAKITPDHNGREQIMKYIMAECAALKVKTEIEDMRRMALIIHAKRKEIV